MVLIPAGKFIRCRGCGPQEEVEIEVSAFRLDQDEVTQGQYAECVRAKRCAAPTKKVKSVHEDEPVRGVSWFDAAAYCKYVGKRLPTVGEWERAAFPFVPDNYNGPKGPRIGTHEPCKSLMIGGYDGKMCKGRPLDGPHEVMLSLLRAGQPDDLLRDQVEVARGIVVYDLYGNVAEWVSDWDSLPNDPEYYFRPTTRKDPQGPASGREKLIVGGSFKALDGSELGEHRWEKPAGRPVDVGFRCAAPPETSK